MWRVTLLVWVSAHSVVVGCRGRCRGRVGCRCTARRPASRRPIGGGVVGRRAPPGAQRRRAARLRVDGADPTPGCRARALGRPLSRRAGRVGVTAGGLGSLSQLGPWRPSFVGADPVPPTVTCGGSGWSPGSSRSSPTLTLEDRPTTERAMPQGYSATALLRNPGGSSRFASLTDEGSVRFAHR